jgi:hypothetical protein
MGWKTKALAAWAVLGPVGAFLFDAYGVKSKLATAFPHPADSAWAAISSPVGGMTILGVLVGAAVVVAVSALSRVIGRFDRHWRRWRFGTRIRCVRDRLLREFVVVNEHKCPTVGCVGGVTQAVSPSGTVIWACTGCDWKSEIGVPHQAGDFARATVMLNELSAKGDLDNAAPRLPS